MTGGAAADDRQWEEFLGSASVYLLYRTLAPAVTQIQRSNDGGFSFGAASTVGAIGQVGPIDVHQATGTVFAPGSTGVMGVGQPATPTGEPLSTDYKVRTAATDPNGVAHLFFVTKVADDGTAKGTVYACYSNDKDIFLKSSPKRLLIRGTGPSLSGFVGSGFLADPILEIKNASGTVIASNDDWLSSQQAEISASGLAPVNDKEAAVIVNLPGGNYTATLQGKNNGQGIGLVEIYDIGAESKADLGNIATRGLAGAGDEVLIGGFIVRDDSFQNQPQRILIRGIGPSIPTTQVPNPLQDPFLELHDAQGAVITSNDDWQSSADAVAISQTTIAPTNPKESAILRTLAPGAYTAVMRGTSGGTGIGLVEIYNLGNQ